MARQLVPAFAYTAVYVKDVARSVAFYSDAFGYKVRRLMRRHLRLLRHYINRLFDGEQVGEVGERADDHRVHAVAPEGETDERTGAVRPPVRDGERGPVEVCFDYPDVDAAYKRAVPVSPPEVKEWGQKVGYVRDMDGIVVRMGSHVGDGTSHV